MSHVDLDRLAELVLAPDDSPAEVRRHVESCSECAATLAALSDVRRLVGEEPLVPVPARVREQVMAAGGRPGARLRPPPPPPSPPTTSYARWPAHRPPRGPAAPPRPSPCGQPGSPPASPWWPAWGSAG